MFDTIRQYIKEMETEHEIDFLDVGLAVIKPEDDGNDMIVYVRGGYSVKKLEQMLGKADK